MAPSATSKLVVALSSVNWNENVQKFLKDSACADPLRGPCERIAVWSRQFESCDSGNPALSFVRAMQASMHNATSLLALSLYSAAAGSMRAMLEAGLYYTYFRTHPTELSTLARDVNYYIDKKLILDFHRVHTADFSNLQSKLGVVQRLGKWYSEISAIVHAQVPGKWVVHKSVQGISFSKPTAELAVAQFVEAEEILHRFFLCTAAQQLWDDFASGSKARLLQGLSGDLKTALALDEA